jgi:hypothetical protein
MAKLSIVRQSHQATTASATILADIGGLPALRRFTNSFYQKAFADPHLDQFIRSHDDPHGERFALWIAEKLGAGTPWSKERRTRQIEVFTAKGHEVRSRNRTDPPLWPLSAKRPAWLRSSKRHTTARAPTSRHGTSREALNS